MDNTNFPSESKEQFEQNRELIRNIEKGNNDERKEG